MDEHAKGNTYEPAVEQGEDEFLAGEVLVEANEHEHRAKHRVAVFEDVDWSDPVKVAVLTATLRHEIEHVRQRMVCGRELFDVDEYADNAIEHATGRLPGALYNLKPIEQDADAAAGTLLRQHFDEGIVAAVLASSDGKLVRWLTPPRPLDTLLPRTVCFIYLFVDVVERVSRKENGISFDLRLDAVSKDAGDLWRHLIRQDNAPVADL